MIERVPADQARTAQQRAFEDQEIYIPLRREEAVVQKDTRVREEVRARKEHQTDTQNVSSEVRKRTSRSNAPAKHGSSATAKPRDRRRFRWARRRLSHGVRANHSVGLDGDEAAAHASASG